MNYYSDNDVFCAAMLQNLIDAQLLPPGHVDCRSIVDVTPGDLKGYTQCHFFAGVGGWPLALRIAGWPDQRKAWTASCPCQPWSRGRIDDKPRGSEDERDLWPVLFKLIKAHEPTVLYGEQVTGARVTPWFKRLRNDMESLDYSVQGDRMDARNYGSSQQRRRYYFLAHANGTRRSRLGTSTNPSETRRWRWRGEKDLQAIARAPFEFGNRWPQPLIRSSDARVPKRVALLRAFGNAIDPYVGAEFVFTTSQGLRTKGNLLDA
jgi:DNA (cytosine-5)-methyltransferase 1